MEAIREWPTPQTVREVCGFPGLTRKGAHFLRDDRCQEGFQKLKEALVSAPVLPYPNLAKPYLLDCDASAEGLGAILSQVKNGQERAISYFSHKFTAPEKNYCVTRKELLAVIKSIDHYHPYLHGTKFVVRTDHVALKWLKTLKNPGGQLARWIGKLEQHNYTI